MVDSYQQDSRLGDATIRETRLISRSGFGMSINLRDASAEWYRRTRKAPGARGPPTVYDRIEQ